MMTAGTTLFAMAAAVLAAFACVITVVGAVQLTASRRHGYFHLVIPAILVTTGLTIALSGRSIELNGALMAGAAIKHPLAVWVQRAGTILILTVAAERIISHYGKRGNLLGATPLLALCFIAYWLGSIASPMFLSAYPAFSHEGFYTLIIGVAALLLTADEGEQVIRTARDSLFIFQLVSYLMLFIKPSLVLDTSYSQGFIPGLPRFAGLSPHALMAGMFAQLSLLCLWAHPYAKTRLNMAAWGIGLLTLLIAQSKTAWISFCLCALTMYLCQHGDALKRRLSDPARPQLALTLVTGFLVATLAIGGASLFGILGALMDNFLNSDSGAQLTTLTGRDVIWRVAYEEWQRHPLFGYGPNFLSLPYRLSLGLPNATHGHNQYMDLLPRAGLAGAIPLTLYLMALLSLSIRHAVASRGLSLALFIAIGLRAISEVPLAIHGYNPEFIGHLLLLVLLPACSTRLASHRQRQPDTAFFRASPQT